jgi:glyoxylase-like metal-dependent hydrolase (beta-lactamase superfamily II)
MRVEELAPGLWYWTAYHEEWKQEVGCASVETADGLVLIDPLVPPGADRERFLAALDRDVERSGGAVHVLVTVYYHARSARELVERYGGRLWASTRARAAIARRAGEPTDRFRPGDRLPGGIRPLATGSGSEVAYLLPDQRALVFGDVVLGADGGGVRLCPASWLPTGTDHERVRAQLQPLLDEQLECIVVTHGEPVRSGGRAALEQALRPPADGGAGPPPT